MATFTLTPNLRRLNSYLTSSSTEDFDEVNPLYEPLPIAIAVDWDIFEDAESFGIELDILLDHYDLNDHRDNLFYLILYTYNRVWHQIQLRYDQYESTKRARELAQLLLSLSDINANKVPSTTFKSFYGSAKVNDEALNRWIRNLIITAIETKDFPASKFGTRVLEMLTSSGDPFEKEPLDLEKLRAYANIRLVNPKNQIKKGAVTISLMVLSYLNTETTLRSTDEVMFTDRQLSFLFDLLSLLKQVDDREIGTIKEDYMRTLLLNYIGK